MPRFLIPTITLVFLLAGCQLGNSATPTGDSAGDSTALHLADTSWIVTHIDGQSVVASGKTPTVVFVTTSPSVGPSEALITGTGGCNNYSASYLQDGKKLSIGDLFSTQMACLDETVMAQELAFTQALMSAVSFSGDAQGITIRDEADAERIRLAPAPH